ncbi:hypothetical protein QZH41_001312 [Actinostola sp. cb2023]|nr:hypothetical protein QZH41_001312 [Actinostola sp. cb2023]
MYVIWSKKSAARVCPLLAWRINCYLIYTLSKEKVEFRNDKPVTDSKSQGQRLPEYVLQFCKQTDLSENLMKEFYQKLSNTYEEVLSATGYVTPLFCSKVFDAAVRKHHADDVQAIRILDIGAGTGLLGALLKELGYVNVDAIDCCDAMLQKASQKNVYQKTVVKFIDEKKNEAIKDGEYEAMISSGAMSAPQIQARAFDEMIRWLKKAYTATEPEKNPDERRRDFKRLHAEDKYQLHCLNIQTNVNTT